MTSRLPTLFTGAFLLLSAASANAESFLRLSAETDLAGLAVQPTRVIDYGAFRWAVVSDEDAARLVAAGRSDLVVADAGEVRVPGYSFDPLRDGEPRARLRRAGNRWRTGVAPGAARRPAAQRLVPRARSRGSPRPAVLPPQQLPRLVRRRGRNAGPRPRLRALGRELPSGLQARQHPRRPFREDRQPGGLRLRRWRPRGRRRVAGGLRRRDGSRRESLRRRRLPHRRDGRRRRDDSRAGAESARDLARLPQPAAGARRRDVRPDRRRQPRRRRAGHRLRRAPRDPGRRRHGRDLGGLGHRRRLGSPGPRLPHRRRLHAGDRRQLYDPRPARQRLPGRRARHARRRHRRR